MPFITIFTVQQRIISPQMRQIWLAQPARQATVTLMHLRQIRRIFMW